MGYSGSMCKPVSEVCKNMHLATVYRNGFPLCDSDPGWVISPYHFYKLDPHIECRSYRELDGFTLSEERLTVYLTREAS